MPKKKLQGVKRSGKKLISKKKASRKPKSWTVEQFTLTDDEDNTERLKEIEPRQYLVPLHTILPLKSNEQGGYADSVSLVSDNDSMADNDDQTMNGYEMDTDIFDGVDSSIGINETINGKFTQGELANSDSENEVIMTPKEKHMDKAGKTRYKETSIDGGGYVSIGSSVDHTDLSDNGSTATGDGDDNENMKVSPESEGQNGYNSDESGHYDNQQSMNVRKVLSENPYSQEVIERYDGSKELSGRDRTTVVDAIVIYALHNKIHLSTKLMIDISLKICRLFPKETPLTYFTISANNTKGGKLFSRYYYKRRLYKRSIEDQSIENSHLNDKEYFEDISEEVANSINILKEEGETTDCYIENWDNTFDYRMRQIEIYETLEDLISEWPIVGKPIGLTLVDRDFKKLHGAISITSEKWNLFFSRNWFYFTRKIKNPKGHTLCNKITRIRDVTAKDAALSYVLHYLLPPALCSRLKKGEKRSRKKPKGRKPSIAASRNTQLRFVKDEDIDLVIQNRRAQFISNKIQSHPYIIGVGETKYRIKHFYVVIGELKFKVLDFITALDYCLKLFILFKIPYPPESKAVWIILNKIFFNINATSVMTARLCEVYNDIHT